MTNKNADSLAEAYLNHGKPVPFGGLAMDLAEALRHGISDLQYYTAMEKVLVLPPKNLGVEWAPFLERGAAEPLEALFERRFDKSNGDLQGHPGLSGLRTLRQIVRYMPILDLPASNEFWAYEAHFTQLLRRLAQGDIAVASLPEIRKWTPMEPLSYAPPEPCGPATIAHLHRFCADFPGLADALSEALPWEGTGAGRYTEFFVDGLLMMEAELDVDFRKGSLVSAACVEHAITLAAGDFGPAGCPPMKTQLLRHVHKNLQEVRVQEILGVTGVFGAAWSCDVNALLNDRRIWSRDGDFV